MVSEKHNREGFFVARSDGIDPTKAEAASDGLRLQLKRIWIDQFLTVVLRGAQRDVAGWNCAVSGRQAARDMLGGVFGSGAFGEAEQLEFAIGWRTACKLRKGFSGSTRDAPKIRHRGDRWFGLAHRRRSTTGPNRKRQGRRLRRSCGEE